MASKVDLYDRAYSNHEAEVYRQVRLDTYGQDFGQTSWVTTEESKEIPKLLDLNANSLALELGSGAGGYALHLAEAVRCSLVGLDINRSGIHNANQLAVNRHLAERVHFEQYDISTRLPFRDKNFDASFSNDVLCHLPGRADVLREIFRVLKPGGKALFSDALVVGGMLSHEEIAVRSSVGYYVFSPPGENERLIEGAGFRLVRLIDTTENAAKIAQRWHAAREMRKTDLAALEGLANFEALQRFLSCVYRLTFQRRLLRNLYVMAKPN